jgi:hypothetical protein
MCDGTAVNNKDVDGECPAGEMTARSLDCLADGMAAVLLNVREP